MSAELRPLVTSSEPSSATPPLMHGDLMSCATDLVLCREASDGLPYDDAGLVATRAAAAAYLIAAFEHGRTGGD